MRQSLPRSSHILAFLLTFGLVAVVIAILITAAACGSAAPAPVDPTECAHVVDCVESSGLLYRPPPVATPHEQMVDTSHFTNLWATGDLHVEGDAQIDEDLTVTDDVEIGGLFTLGTGTPLVAAASADAFISGTVEISGSLYAQTNIYLPDAVWNGIVDGNLVLGDSQDAAIGYFPDAINDDYLLLYSPHRIQAGLVATGTFEVDTGNLMVGNGTPTGSLDGEDAYIEGTLEVDGAASFDNDINLAAGYGIMHDTATNEGVVFASKIDLTYSVTSTVTGGAIPGGADVIDWALVVYTAFDGSGTDIVVCGISGDTDKWVDDLDVSAAGRNAAGDANDMQLDEWATSWGDIGAGIQTAQCQYTDQNTDATAGGATFIIWYRLD